MNETPKELDAAVKVILDYKPPWKDVKDTHNPGRRPSPAPTSAARRLDAQQDGHHQARVGDGD